MSQTIELSIPQFLEGWRSGKIPDDARVSVTFEVVENDAVAALREQWSRADARISREESEEDARIYAQIEKQGITRSAV